MNEQTDNITAYIIAGGKSSRFGMDKSLHILGGIPLIEHVILALRPVFSRIGIIADDGVKFEFLGLPCYPDIIPGLGPMGGLYTALSHSNTDKIFVTACDMPNLNSDFISYMASRSKDYDVVIPVINEYYEALHAIYSSNCLVPVQKSIKEGKRQIFRFFDEVRVLKISEKEIAAYAEPSLIFKNINSVDDLPKV
jgi:molybdenum cofactor guanylyltransferase